MRRAALALLLPALALASSRVEDDARPLGRYLTADGVLAVVLAGLPEAAACYTHSSARGRVEVGEVFIDFVIAPGGEVAEATVRSSRSSAPDLDACLVEAVRALAFPDHDEAPLEAGYPFVFREGALQPYPMVFLKERPLPLLFFALPGGAEDQQALVDALLAGG